MKLKKMLSYYRKAINPPYSHKDIPSLMATIALLLVLPLTVFLALQQQSFQQRAAGAPEVQFVDSTNATITQTTSPTVSVRLTAPWPAAGTVQGIFTQADAQTPAQPRVLEAESMTLPRGASVFSDSNASGGQGMVLKTNGTARGSITTTGNTVSIVIRARGDVCQGSPRMTVTVDNTRVVRVSVASTTWSDYTTSAVTFPAGNHSVSVAFDNDHYRVFCDRNLRIDKITFNQSGVISVPTPTTVPPTTVPPTSIPPTTVPPTSIPPTATTVPPTSVPPTATPQPYTATVTISEDPTFLQNAITQPYTVTPLIMPYTFTNTTPGTKTLFVKFHATTGEERLFSNTIDLIAPTQPTTAPASGTAPTSTLATGTIWGAVDPLVLGECSAAVHDKYMIQGDDGFMYRTWHPQVDPSGCVFAHEHGDNPDKMTDTWVRQNWDGRFGYAARRMTSVAEPNGHAEAHEGYKVFVANIGDVNDENRTNLTATLSTFHMGTGTPKRFTLQHHSNSIAYRYQTGSPYAATHLMMDTGGVSDVCDPRANAPTKDGILLQNRCKVNSSYEIWGTFQTIKSGGREIYRGFATPAVFDAITVFNKDNPLEVVYAWDPRVAAVKNFPDDWSNHRGCERESYAQVGYFYNAGGQTTYYTDPMGNVVSQTTPGAIKQTVSASNVVGVLSTNDGLSQYKKHTSYCQQIGKLGLKN